jgi:hypothetical protein
MFNGSALCLICLESYYITMLIYYHEEDKGSKDKLPPLRTFLGSAPDRDSSLPKVQESLLGYP